MASVLLVGAMGLVGRHVLERALGDERIDRVVAPTRGRFPLRRSSLTRSSISRYFLSTRSGGQ